MKLQPLQKSPVKLTVLGGFVQSDTTVSTGTAKKPDWCFNNCPRARLATGFVPDWVPDNPKIAFIFSHPAKDDVGEREPLRGGLGRYFWATIGRVTGLKKEDCLFSNILRCYTWKYPVGKESKVAEQACRHWDNHHASEKLLPKAGRSLVSWGPNLFIPTFGLDSMIEIGAFEALAIQDVKKALRFAEDGFRPLVVMGVEALGVVAPWLEYGGVKAWRGHWWEGDWKWKNGVELGKIRAEMNQKTFEPATFRSPWGTRSKKVKEKPAAKQENLFGE